MCEESKKSTLSVQDALVIVRHEPLGGPLREEALNVLKCEAKRIAERIEVERKPLTDTQLMEWVAKTGALFGHHQYSRPNHPWGVYDSQGENGCFGATWQDAVRAAIEKRGG